jgi:hypothetical protein
VLDGATSGHGLTSPASAAALATTNPRDLVIFAVADGAPNAFGVAMPGTWTAMLAIDGGITQAEWYAVASATATFAPTVTETSGNWDAVLAAFRFAP